MEEENGFYHQAIQVDGRLALGRLGDDLARHLGLTAPLNLSSWEQAVGSLLALDRLVVLDEFPYFSSSSPELPSVIQAMLDERRMGRAEATGRLILCGSSLSVMSGVLGGHAPLRGRATLDLVVRPFDFRTAAAFWGLASQPEIAFAVDAVLGGGPGYRDLMGGRVPTALDELGDWLALGPLNPAHALFTEDDYLLREEATITDKSHYLSVLSAIAAGHTTSGGIANHVGRDSRSLHHTLGSLDRGGLIDKTDDALRDNRPTYRLADPIVRFCRLITQQEIARFELGRWREALLSRSDSMAAGIFGPHFEHLARVFVQQFADETTTGGPVSKVGPAVVADPGKRTSIELDVVALSRQPSDRLRVVALGEAKSGRHPRGVTDLQRLERSRDVVAATRGDRFSVDAPKLLLFSRSGFDRELRDAASHRADVELIDLDRIYHGS